MIAPAPTPQTTDTRTRLLEAAHTLIWQNSYSSVSVDDICRRASVNKGSFYHFFPSKTTLAIAAIDDHWQTIAPELEKILASAAKAQEMIKQLAQFIHDQQKQKFDEIGHVCGCPYASLGSEMSMQDEPLRKAVEAKLENATGYLEKILETAVAQQSIDKNGLKEKAREMDVFIIGIMTTARVRNNLDLFKHDLEHGLLRIAGLQ
ncbi:MAG: TetR/AcrR family transcriptional regulator [Alphaproteobacteria bacterium]|nr:TetR/AcrR family transcriptional regulator [Alphaproteobacteria bacterium]